MQARLSALLAAWVVLKVEGKIRVVVVRPFGCALQELSTLKMTDAHPNVDMSVQFVPRVAVVFLANVCPRFSTRIANDSPSGCVVKPIDSAGQPKVQILSCYRPAMPWLDGEADPLRNNILPPELIDNAEAVVSRRIHSVECALPSVGEMFFTEA